MAVIFVMTSKHNQTNLHVDTNCNAHKPLMYIFKRSIEEQKK